MGWSFRRSRHVGPFRFTLSKGGLGWSVGNSLARFGVRADGRVVQSLSVPGTGLSHQSTVGRVGSGAGLALRLGCGCASLIALAFLSMLTLGAFVDPSNKVAAVVSALGWVVVAIVGTVVLARRPWAPRPAAQPSMLAPPAYAAPTPAYAPAPSPELVWRDGYFERRCPNPACGGTIQITMETVQARYSVCSTCRATVQYEAGVLGPVWSRLFEHKREVRRQRIMATYDEATAQAILRQEPFVGATQEIIKEMFGEPENVTSQMLKKGPRVTWRYGQIGSSSRYSTRIQFTNGLCDTWKVGDT